jgi:exosortase
MATGAQTITAKPQIIIPIATFLLHAVFLGGLGFWLWSREHYQFFPLVLIGSLALGWYRLNNQLSPVEWGNSAKLSLRVLGLGVLASLCFAVAAIFGSNWFGAIAAICSGWALIWLYGGTTLANQLRGPVFLLLLGIPLPLNFDLKLIIRLQKIASLQASRLLDLYHVRHNISGVAISTGDRSFMVEEACSGIHSLFSCLCVIVFISVVQRYGLIRILINVAQSVVWVVAANVVRVFLVVYAHVVWAVALDSGWRHEVLGMLTYAMALLMSISTDRLMQFIVPHGGSTVAKKDSNYEISKNPLAQLLAFVEESRVRMNKFLDRPRLSEAVSLKLIAGVLVLLFLPLSAVSYGRVVSRWFAAPAVATNDAPESLGDIGSLLTKVGAMPSGIDGWTLVRTERVDRSPDDPLGMSSLIHTYQGHGLEVSFSVDGYYSGWHDLAYCYTALDWKLKDQANSRDEFTKYFSTRLNLWADDGQYLLNYFSCFDSQLVPVRPGDQSIGTIRTFENLLERVGLKPAPAEKDPPITLPVFQLHLMCVSPQELLDHEKDSLRVLFDRLSQHTLESLRGASR